MGENLIERAVTTTVERTHQRELHWFSDGWHGYQSILVRAYRQRKLTGKRGRASLGSLCDGDVDANGQASR